MDAEEHKKRIAEILSRGAWEKSKSAQKKLEREIRAEKRKTRLAKKPRDRPLEWEEQKVVCKWMVKHGVDFFAPSPELAGNDVDEVRLQWFRSLGFKSGIPDLILVSLAKDGRPVAIEMKRTKLTESSLSPPQKKQRGIFKKRTWHYILGIGAEPVIQRLIELDVEHGPVSENEEQEIY